MAPKQHGAPRPKHHGSRGGNDERRGQRAEQRKPKPHRNNAPRGSTAENGQYWLFGWHAVIAALANPNRRFTRLVCSPTAERELPELPKGIRPEIRDTREIESLVGANAVHQGIALSVYPLESLDLHEVLDAPETGTAKPPILLLDQVTDPHNIGAILRSAAAFGVCAVLTPKDHGARESATMAKAACGALDMVPLVEVTNLAQTIRTLKDAGYWIYGLDGEAKTSLHQQKQLDACALVLGAEGKGMRRLTAELCDTLIKLPIDNRMESLNVSNAAAIALYQIYIMAQKA